MKTLPAILMFVLVFGLDSTIQAQTSLNKFCEVIAYPGHGSKERAIITLDYGRKGLGRVFTDSTFENYLNKVVNEPSPVAALEYMEGMGWELITVLPISSSANGQGKDFLFKRKFKKADFENLKETKPKKGNQIKF